MTRALPTLTLLLLSLAACAGDGSSTPDAGGDDVAPDADPGAPDANPDNPDAMPDPVGLVQCPTAVPAPTEGSCDVVDGTGTAVVVRGNVLGDGATYLDGEVMYVGDEFVCRGCDCSGTAGYATATVISCAGAVVSPGLINAHDHITFDNHGPLPSTAAGGTRYLNRRGWRGPVSTPSNQGGTGATSAGMRWNEFRDIFAGTTSIVGSGRANGLIRNLDQLTATDTPLGFGTVEYQTFILQDSSGSSNAIPANCGFDYKFTDLEVAAFPGMVTHTGEGLDAYSREEFRCVSAQMVGRDFVENNVAHIHGIALDAANYFDMARDNASLIWSPRSNIALYGNTASPQVMVAVGGNVALGTDWIYSGSSTISREMTCAAEFDDAYLGNVFSDEDIWRMATINAAVATDTEALIGSIEVGKISDLAVFRAGTGVLHRAVIDALSDDVLLTVRDGDVLFGEADVVAALDASCETVDICGASRRVCASRELSGATFASVVTAMDAFTGVYPAIVCAIDAAEPTCIPSRPGEYTGVAGANDPDGDGIVTASDDCPTVFNPKRSVDGANQADTDGDNVGDACDPTPIGADLDADTFGNATDVCPFVAGAQTDTDSDGKGNACDYCPEVANPDSVCAPSLDPDPITEIQNGTIGPNANVNVVGAVVTSVLYNGFTMQDPTVTSGQYAGVVVYTGSAPSLSIGDIVTVSGKTTEFNGLTELIDASIVSSTSGGTIPAPIALTVAAAMNEMYEGTLVTLTDLTTINTAYACTADDAACGDTNTWLLNGSVVAWDAAWPGSDPEWIAEGTGLAAAEPITGVMTYRWGRVRIMPRTGADIGN